MPTRVRLIKKALKSSEMKARANSVKGDAVNVIVNASDIGIRMDLGSGFYFEDLR